MINDIPVFHASVRSKYFFYTNYKKAVFVVDCARHVCTSCYNFILVCHIYYRQEGTLRQRFPVEPFDALDLDLEHPRGIILSLKRERKELRKKMIERSERCRQVLKVRYNVTLKPHAQYECVCNFLKKAM